MPPVELSTDVLLEIFALTDVCTIMVLARVNRLFHGISLIKQLWLSVVRELSLARLIDAPADETLETLSTEDLIGEVRRVVSGPKTWSPGSSLPPTVQRQFSLLLDTSTLNGGRPPKLLPGGTHMIVYISGPAGKISGLECWDVFTGQKVWRWGRPEYTLAEEVSDLRGATLVVIVVFVDPASPPGETYQTRILEVDMANKDSVKLSRLVINPIPSSNPQLCGDFLILKVLQQTSLLYGRFSVVLLLLNWRTQEGVVLDPEFIVSYTLFPDHVVLACASRSNPHHLGLHLYTIPSFHDLRRQLWDLTRTVGGRTTDISHIPFARCSVPIPNESTYLLDRSPISVTRSPLHDATYHCVVQVLVQPNAFQTPLPSGTLRAEGLQNTPPHPDEPVTKKVFRYYITFPTDAETSASPVLAQFRLKTTRSVPGHIISAHTAHAEYYLRYNKSPPALLQLAHDDNSEEGLPVFFSDSEALNLVHLTRSGALLEVRQTGVVVSYYR
ncbi:hypothetical protein DFH06DRAFT_1154941 [Mycena polygramma]|nr:hypothetical protein DFH06DRAFT_1154941 [Mycena polygramma]